MIKILAFDVVLLLLVVVIAGTSTATIFHMDIAAT